MIEILLFCLKLFSVPFFIVLSYVYNYGHNGSSVSNFNCSGHVSSCYGSAGNTSPDILESH